MKYNKQNPLRVVTLCSGYDSQCLALERLKKNFPEFDYELVAWAEFDPESTKPIEKQDAVIVHNALFQQWADRNLGDMTKINWHEVPDFDFLFYSTPCQSISQAGLQHGFTEGSGTRSSIIWNVRDALAIKKPKYACLENVAAMVSEKFMPMFNLWRAELTKLGYISEAKLLNSKNYNVPQNRERIFLFSCYDETKTFILNWPEPMKLTRKLTDVLEDNVDPSFYLNPAKVNKFVKDNLQMITKYAKEDGSEIEKLPERLKKMIEDAQDTEEDIEESEQAFVESEIDFDSAEGINE